MTLPRIWELFSSKQDFFPEVVFFELPNRRHAKHVTRYVRAGGGDEYHRKVSIYNGKFRATRLVAACSGDEAIVMRYTVLFPLEPIVEFYVVGTFWWLPPISDPTESRGWSIVGVNGAVGRYDIAGEVIWRWNFFCCPCFCISHVSCETVRRLL